MATISQHISRKSLMPNCPLFEGRAFQYGPACAVLRGKPSRVLVYYPLGSGKTLAAIHAARTFLNMHPNGQVHVITTKVNVNSTWPTNMALYNQSVDTEPLNIHVHNVEWWFSQSNAPVAHYNALIQKMTEHSYGSNRLTYMLERPRMLKLEACRLGMAKELKAFRKSLLPEQKHLSMIQACIPKEPYLLIVDECQLYIQSSAQTTLIRTLAEFAKFSLFLSGTPINDSRQYAGLCQLLGRRNLSASVLWTPDQSEKPTIIDLGDIVVEMTSDEWQTHQAVKKTRTYSGMTQNAYLNKTRQACNNISKWLAIAQSIEKNIASGVRIVVYSFFLHNGVDGFFKFLRHRYSFGKLRGNQLRLKLKDVKVAFSKLSENTLDWFNDNRSTAKILLLTSRSGTGISLKNVSYFHIMEPQWSIADEEQAIGRATRKGSHDRVAPVVNVTHWMSVPPKGSGIQKSADQQVRESMLRKKKRTEHHLTELQKWGSANLMHLLLRYS